jgi:hypothetical protein
MKPWDRELDLYGQRVMIATKNDPAPTGVAVAMIVQIHRMGRWWALEGNLTSHLWREQWTR